jgi:hypothetical protein
MEASTTPVADSLAVRWAMADIVKKLNFKVGAGPTGQFDRNSEDIVLSIYYSRIVICLPLSYN